MIEQCVCVCVCVCVGVCVCVCVCVTDGNHGDTKRASDSVTCSSNITVIL